MISDKNQRIIIVAGGKGVRVGGDCPKQFQLLSGKPMLMHTIQAFFDYNHRMDIIVVLPFGFDVHWKELCEIYGFDIPHTIVIGGETRFHSVKNGLAEVAENDIVGVHDGARPLVTRLLIERCFAAAAAQQCGIVPVVDEPNSVRVVTETGSSVMDRSTLKIVQTPQVFPAAILKKAYETEFNPMFTDDASVVEQKGFRIALVPGEETNIKITSAFDLRIAEIYLQSGEKNHDFT